MNFSLATPHLVQLVLRNGAHDRNRTGDLVLTKDVLYRLSYVGTLQNRLNSTSLSLLSAAHSSSRRARNGAGDGNRTHTISLEG